MPRKLREDVAGAVHHVFARGNDRRRIYVDDVDRRRYLELLADVVQWTRWSCLAYCLMDNHVHLVIEAPRANLGSGMQQLHGRYAQDFNKRHRRSGHLFQGRYGGTPVRSDAQLFAVVAYVVRNPVEGGLCAGPDEWAWSSHAATLGAWSPAWLDVGGLLMRLAALGGNPLRRYSELVGG